MSVKEFVANPEKKMKTLKKVPAFVIFEVHKVVLCMAIALGVSMVPQAATAGTAVLKAVDTDSINTAGDNWNDNRIRAYYSGALGHLDGFIKFDLSSIPEAAVITSMTLVTYHEAGGVSGAPNVSIYRVSDDSWSRASTSDPHPGLNEKLTSGNTGFPTADEQAYVWSLDVNAADFVIDLLDGVLSLGMRNENETYSYIYWYGSDQTPAPPVLVVDYTVPENQIILTAVDTDSINTAGSNWNDNRIRAYYSATLDHLDGFIKFDLSSIPDAAVITSMTLVTYHEAGGISGDPNVRLYRVSDDNWSRASTSDPHPGLDEVLTPGHSGFPTADQSPCVWSLDVDCKGLPADLIDDVLSLGMRNENETYSYIYWYGSDATPAPPVLVVGYSAPANLAVLTAVDSDSINTLDSNWDDNRIRAYYSDTLDHLDGFIKFDLSSIPDAAVITSMTLVTFHEADGISGDPNVHIYRVSDDTWSRASTSDPHPGLNGAVTASHMGFPTADQAAFVWPLDLNAIGRGIDLVDNVLSLGMRNENETYSYIYWYGSDSTPAPPLLMVGYSTCHYGLVGDLNDDCAVNFFDIALAAQNWLRDCALNPDDPACTPQ